MKKLLLIVSVILTMSSCTSNTRARRWGGTEVINLEPNEKLVNITWKNNDLWILTRKAKTDEKPEVFEFSEKSSVGLLNGTIVIKEQ